MRPLLRQAYLRAARSASSHVATNIDGIAYLASTHDDGPGRAMVLFGKTPELDTLPRALALLKSHGETYEGRVLVDVGANIGTTSLPALLRHGFERVVAIEPEPENVRVLRANAALNDVHDRLDIVAAAAGTEPGVTAFRRGKSTRRGWRAGAGSILTEGESDGIAVSVVTVDGELEQRGLAASDIGLLWLDVQGHEGHVLAGARQLVDDSRPVVFALRPRKLKRVNGLEPLVELITRRYGHVVDLRPREAKERWKPNVLDSSSLLKLAATRPTTDVLAFGSRDRIAVGLPKTMTADAATA